MSTVPRVTAVIVHYRAEELLDECLSALRRVDDVPLEVVAVDNNSFSEPASWVERFPWVRWVFAPQNRGFAAGANAGAALGRAEYLFMLNPDARPLPGCLPQLVRVLDANPQVAAAGPQLLSPSGEPRPSAGRAPNLQRLLGAKLARVTGRRAMASDAMEDVEVDWLSGAALLCRRRAWDGVRGMDEGFFLYYEDCDLGVRLRERGWRLLLVQRAKAVHVGGASFAGDLKARLQAFRRSEERYFRKHRPPLELVAIKALRPLYDALGLRSAFYPETAFPRHS